MQDEELLNVMESNEDLMTPHVVEIKDQTIDVESREEKPILYSGVMSYEQEKSVHKTLDQLLKVEVKTTNVADEWDPYLFVKAFPVLFPFGRGGIGSEKNCNSCKLYF